MMNLEKHWLVVRKGEQTDTPMMFHELSHALNAAQVEAKQSPKSFVTIYESVISYQAEGFAVFDYRTQKMGLLP